MSIRRAGTVLAACALALIAALSATPSGARADGDPASDVLLTENVFLPYAPPVSPALAGALTATVARAHAAGFPIKVALIESAMDLGADPELFGTPQRYARFLDTEITYNDTPPLLVVMPQGAATAATVPTGILAAVHVDAAARSDGLARAAIAALITLARRAGHPIAAPALPQASAPSGGAHTVIMPIVGGALAVIAAAAGALALRRRRSAAVS